MSHFQPQTVAQLATIIDDICLGLQDHSGRALPGAKKEALAKRVFELFENGITDPDRLRLEVMADGLWASAAHAMIERSMPEGPPPATPPGQSPLRRAYKLARSGECRSLKEIGRRLKQEGYEGIDALLTQASTLGDLTRILKAADKV